MTGFGVSKGPAPITARVVAAVKRATTPSAPPAGRTKWGSSASSTVVAPDTGVRRVITGQGGSWRAAGSVQPTSSSPSSSPSILDKLNAALDGSGNVIATPSSGTVLSPFNYNGPSGIFGPNQTGTAGGAGLFASQHQLVDNQGNQLHANALDVITSAALGRPVTMPGSNPNASNVIPFPGAQSPFSPYGGGSGGGSDGGGGGSGGSGGSSGSASDGSAPGDDYGYDDGGDDGTGDDGQPYQYGSDNAGPSDMPQYGDSGGYSQQGGGSPADTYAQDMPAVDQTESYNPPDRDTGSPDYGGYMGPAGFDNDDDEDTGGQDVPMTASDMAPEAPAASWKFDDRHRMPIPHHMYDSPRRRPGGEEGDDDMDAGDYVAALNGYQTEAGAGMAGFLDALKSVGQAAGIATLNATAKSLGAAGAKPVVVKAPPMSTAAKIGIAVAVGVPLLYLFTRKKSAPTPAVATNPRRRRRRRR